MIDIKTLKQIGIEEKEAKIYLALLELGETTVIPLSKKAGIPRTTCYSVIEKMAKKGLLSQTPRGAHTYISPASPEKIKEIAILKEQEAKVQRELAEKLIPQLTYATKKLGTPKMQYFSGRQGVRSIFEDLLTSGEVKNYYIGSVQAVVRAVGERFMKDWVKRRVRAGIFSYGIRIKSEEGFRTTFKSSRKMLREVRFAPETFKSPLYLMIYGKKIAFITSKEENFGLIVDSEDFTKTMKSMFDVIWANSERWRKKQN